jgi:hypothetical protein
MSTMPTLIIHFEIRFHHDNPRGPHGPVFHRWLPYGRADAIDLPTDDKAARLRVWFDRWGTTDDSHITYNWQKREVDPAIMVRQAVLYGGSLDGDLTLSDVTDDELRALSDIVADDENTLEDSPLARALGERVVGLIYDPVASFVETLRVRYGQYWLEPVKRWDEKKVSLGAYCGASALLAEWSCDGEKTWKHFTPTRVIWNAGSLGGSVAAFFRYLTQQDWCDIAARAARRELHPSDVAQVVGRAHHLAEDGELRLALVEAVTALEVAVSVVLRRHFSDAQAFRQALKSFDRATLAGRVTAASGYTGRIPAEHVKKLIEGIEARNRIVHAGAPAPNNVRDLLYSVLDAATLFDSGERFKYPSKPGGRNYWMSLEQWEKASTPGQRGL